MGLEQPATLNPTNETSDASLWSSQGAERGIKSVAAKSQSSAKIVNPQVPGGFFRLDESHAEALETEIDDGDAAPQSIEPSKPKVEIYEEKKRDDKAIQSSVFESFAKLSIPVQPNWEVDQFLWPSSVVALLDEQAATLREISLHLQHAQSQGLRALAITSGERGVGKSTVAMALAKELSKSGLRIALVDGDTENPSLADQLNLELNHGWQEAITENVPLDEVAVSSVEERITFFPLTEALSTHKVEIHRTRINKLLRRISAGYDLTIFDCNRLNVKRPTIVGTGEETVIDAALVIVDAQLSIRSRIDAAVDLLQQQGIGSVGLAENFYAKDAA
jgi:Mrp family chromosome partitioning ATPase